MLRVLLRINVVLLMTITLVARFGYPAILASEISSMALVEQANYERQKADLTPLKYNKKLEAAAFAKAENMFKLQYWAHYGPNKESPWQFILASGYSYTYAGENLAKGYTSSQGVHDAWMASPTHRENIMDPQFQEVGIAVVKGNLKGGDVYLVVQMFGSTQYGISNNNGTKPYVKINNPQEGDILDGIKDIRGEVKNIDQITGVTVNIGDELIGRAGINDTSFSISAENTNKVGQQVITAKAKGNNEEYISDNIKVTILSTESNKEKSSKECFLQSSNNVNITLKYVCDEGAQLSGQVEGVKYINDGKSTNEISIPISSISSPESIAVLEAKLSSNSVVSVKYSLSELGYKNAEKNTVNPITSVLSTISLKNITNWGFVLFVVLLAFYILELIKKRQLLESKHELFSVLFLVGILFISFNFGYIRV